MSAADVPMVTGEEIFRLMPPDAAAAAITAALISGIDPANDPGRVAVDLAHGQMLLMPSHTEASAGLKVVTVAPGNPARSLPRIQGLYLLFDPETLTLQALLDGSALTNVRTPAVSAAALIPLAGRFTDSLKLVVFGAGPQATGHVKAIEAIPALRLQAVSHVVPRPERETLGYRANQVPTDVYAVGSAGAKDAVREADLIVCATTARTPVFDGNGVRDGAIVIAVGSHEPDAREVDSTLMARSTVIVEDVATALREAGDVVIAARSGHLRREAIVAMADVVNGRVPIEHGKTVVFKSTGMAWQDLVVAQSIMVRRNISTN